MHKNIPDISWYHLTDEDHPDRRFNMDRMEDIYERSQGKTNDPHRHDFYTVVWIKQGAGKHLIDFNLYTIEDNQVYFIHPGRVHQIDTPDQPQGCVISFTRDFLLANNISEDFMLNVHLFRQYEDTPPLFIDPELSLKLEAIVNDMFSIFTSGVKHREEALGALMKLFLIYCDQVCDLADEEVNHHSATHLVREFKKLVEGQYKKWHKVNEYADALFITPKYLNEVFKELTGYTSKDYIQDKISTEAKRQLLYSNRTIKEIAYDLGFKEQFHFSAFFKNCTGISPKSFRSSGS